MGITNKLFSYDRRFSKGQMRTPSAEILQIAELSLIRGGEITAHTQNCDEIHMLFPEKQPFIPEIPATKWKPGRSILSKRANITASLLMITAIFTIAVLGISQTQAAKISKSF